MIDTKKILDTVDEIADALPVALDVLEGLSNSLPQPEGAAVMVALKTIRVLLEEGENAADAARKVRAAYSARAQALADELYGPPGGA
jgi:hypothetical protein